MPFSYKLLCFSMIIEIQLNDPPNLEGRICNLSCILNTTFFKILISLIPQHHVHGFIIAWCDSSYQRFSCSSGQPVKMLLGSFSVGSNAHKDFGCYSKIPVFYKKLPEICVFCFCTPLIMVFLFTFFDPFLTALSRQSLKLSPQICKILCHIYVRRPTS